MFLGVLQDFDSNAFAKYQFTNNNFNGSGNFTTTGNITADTYFGDGSQLTGINEMDYTYLFLSNQTNTNKELIIQGSDGSGGNSPDVLVVTGGTADENYAGGIINLTSGNGFVGRGGNVYITSGKDTGNTDTGGDMYLTTGGGGGASYGSLYLVKNGGSISIGKATAPGYTVDINGTLGVSGALTYGSMNAVTALGITTTSDAQYVVNITGGKGGFTGSPTYYGLSGEHMQFITGDASDATSKDTTGEGGNFTIITGRGQDASAYSIEAGGSGGTFSLTTGIGGDSGNGQDAGDGGDIELTTGVGGDTGSYGNVILVKNGGGVLIGTNNESKVNSTNLLYIDGTAQASAWLVTSDENLKSEISIVDNSSTRNLYKYKLQYDIPIYETIYVLKNVSVCNPKNRDDCWWELKEVPEQIVTGYEIKYTDYTYGLMANEMSLNNVRSINGFSSIDLYSLISENYVNIGKLQDKIDLVEQENIELKAYKQKTENCFKAPTDFAKLVNCMNKNLGEIN